MNRSVSYEKIKESDVLYTSVSNDMSFDQSFIVFKTLSVDGVIVYGRQ